MRPQQKNRQRGRGQGGGNRGRNQNPLQRSYESNGPDLKVRGNAQQVADKYTQLARDATSAGDRVMAENYLQHAEHYNRIITVAQAEQAEFQRRRDEQQRERDDRHDRRDRDRDRRDDGDRHEARRDDRDGDDRNDRRRRRRRDEEDRQQDGRQQEGRPQGGRQDRQQLDASEAPQPELGDLPIARANGEASRGDEAEIAEKRPRRGRRTRPAPMETASDDAPSTGDSDAAGDAPSGAEDGLARTVTRTRRRKAPVEKPEPAASDAAE